MNGSKTHSLAHPWYSPANCLFRWVRLLLMGVALVTNACMAESSEPAPAASVEKLHAGLLDIMQHGATRNFQARAATIAPVIREVFDFDTISRVVTGRYWSTLSATQKDAFTRVFTRLSIATYTENFKSFGGERFQTRDTVSKGPNRLVATALTSADGTDVTLNYLLSLRDGKWRIVNVIAEGVSDLSLKRAEYTAVISSDGIDALIAKLSAKVASYER